MKRDLEHYTVIGQQQASAWYTTAQDFKLQYKGVCQSNQSLVINSTAYALNFATERIINVGYTDSQQLLDATFLYNYQKQSARDIISIPFEAMSEFAAESWNKSITTTAPTLVFSIGRAGSTLLSKMLSAANIPSLSEPDVYTHYSRVADHPESHNFPGLTLVPEVLAYATMGYLHACKSNQAAIKFRGQVNSIADQLMQALPKANGFMLLRNAVDCAKSMHRAFGWSADDIADKTAQAVMAVHLCQQAGRQMAGQHQP